MFYRRYVKCEPGMLLQEREGTSKRNGEADNYHVLDTLAFYLFVCIYLFYVCEYFACLYVCV